MNQPWQWNEDDLLRLIAVGAQESLELDYKRCDAIQKTDRKKHELSKDISAFANSAGGTIVYGMIEDGHVPTQIDSGFDPNEISKEWIEQIINSRIQRRIPGVRINQIALDKTSPSKVAYVVHIPQSEQAPHQAADKRFYKRFNFESTPMEEYEVRDVSGRSSGPQIDVQFRFVAGVVSVELTPMDEHYFQPVRLTASITNYSPTPAPHAVFHFYFDARLRIEAMPDELRPGGEHCLEGGSEEPLVMKKYTALWDSNKGIPIFSSITAELPADGLAVTIPRDASKFAIRHQVGAPGMEPTDGFTVLSVVDGQAHLDKYEADGGVGT